LVATIAHIGRDLAAIAVDDAFRDYAEAIGAAQEKLLAGHFTVESGEVRLSTKSNAELRKLADATGMAYRDAPDALVKALAAAGAANEVSMARIESDAYRAIAASVLQSNLTKGPPYDSLRGYEEAIHENPSIADAAERAARDPAAAQAFEAAMTAYREQA